MQSRVLHNKKSIQHPSAYVTRVQKEQLSTESVLQLKHKEQAQNKQKESSKTKIGSEGGEVGSKVLS